MLKTVFHYLLRFACALEIFIVVESLIVNRKDFLNSANCRFKINGNSSVKGFNITVENNNYGHRSGVINNYISYEEVIIFYSCEFNEKINYIRLPESSVNFIVSEKCLVLKLVSPACQNRSSSKIKEDFRIEIKSRFKLTCKDPGIPEHGFRQGIEFAIGSVVVFSCTERHYLYGHTHSKCIQNKITRHVSWSNSLPKCVASCEKPIPPKFGIIVGKRYSLNSSLIVLCNEPFSLEGKNTLTCILGQNGKPIWNENIPKCALKSCEKEVLYVSKSVSSISSSEVSKTKFNKPRCLYWEIKPLLGHCIELTISKTDSQNRNYFKIFDKDSDIFIYRNKTKIYRKFTLCDNVYIYHRIETTNQGTDQHIDRSIHFTYMAKPVTDTMIFRKRKLAELEFNRIEEEDEPTLLSTTTGVSSGNGGGSDNHAGAIAAGVIVPVFILSVIGIIIYIWYRKKYPVRMIIGKDFGKFTNPQYEKRASTLTLVRENSFDASYKKDIEAGAMAKEVSTHDENTDYINEQQYQPTNLSYASQISMTDVPGNSPELVQKQYDTSNKNGSKKNDTEPKLTKKLKDKKIRDSSKGSESLETQNNSTKQDDANDMMEDAEKMIAEIKIQTSSSDSESDETESIENRDSPAENVDGVSNKQTDTETEAEIETKVSEIPDVGNTLKTTRVTGSVVENGHGDTVDSGNDDIIEKDRTSEQYIIATQDKIGERQENQETTSDDETNDDLLKIGDKRNRENTMSDTTSSHEDIVTDLDESFDKSSDPEISPEDKINAVVPETDDCNEYVVHEDVVTGKDEVTESVKDHVLTPDDKASRDFMKIDHNNSEPITSEETISLTCSSESYQSSENSPKRIEVNKCSDNDGDSKESSEYSFVVLPASLNNQNTENSSDEVIVIENEFVPSDTFSMENSFETDHDTVSAVDKRDIDFEKDEVTNSLCSESRVSESLDLSETKFEIIQRDEYVLRSEDDIVVFPSLSQPVSDSFIEQTDINKQEGTPPESFEIEQPQLMTVSNQSTESKPERQDDMPNTLINPEDGDFSFFIDNDKINNAADNMDTSSLSNLLLDSNDQTEEFLKIKPTLLEIPADYEILNDESQDSSFDELSPKDNMSSNLDTMPNEEGHDESLQNEARRESVSLENLGFDFGMSYELMNKQTNNEFIISGDTIPSSEKRKSITIDHVKLNMDSLSSDSDGEDERKQSTATSTPKPILLRRESITADNPGFDTDQNVGISKEENDMSFVVLDTQDRSKTIGNNEVNNTDINVEPSTPKEPAQGQGGESSNSNDVNGYNEPTESSRKKITFNLADISDSDTSPSDTESDSSSDGDEGSYTFQQN